MRGAAALFCSLACAAALQAQGGERTIAGRLSRPGATPAGLPVAGTWVTLHRVGPDAAGPVDSMRTAANGSYRFRYHATGDTNAVYFVSTSSGGVNYFTPPTRDVAVSGDAADMVVYDTTSAAIPVTVTLRSFIITAPDSNKKRTVLEAYQVVNDSTLTRIAAGENGVTFDAPLPRGVTQVSAGQGDISAGTIRAANGRVEVNAPISPGQHQFTFTYEIPANGDALDVLVERPVGALEVLVEEPSSIVQGAGLVADQPAQIEGRLFGRFVATGVGAAQTFTVTIPPSASARSLRLMLVVTAVGAAMLMGLGMLVLKRGPAFTRKADDAEALALEIAALDAAYERIAEPTEQQKAEHYMSRARLKGRLTTALAKRDGLA